MEKSEGASGWIDGWKKRPQWSSGTDEQMRKEGKRRRGGGGGDFQHAGGGGGNGSMVVGPEGDVRGGKEAGWRVVEWDVRQGRVEAAGAGC